MGQGEGREKKKRKEGGRPREHSPIHWLTPQKLANSWDWNRVAEAENAIQVCCTGVRISIISVSQGLLWREARDRAAARNPTQIILSETQVS